MQKWLLCISVICLIIGAVPDAHSADDSLIFVLDCTLGGMQSTGFMVDAGDSLLIIAKGMWLLAADDQVWQYWVGPGGSSLPVPNLPCETAAVASVIGEIAGTCFWIGDQRLLVAESDGELLIGVNDPYQVDNFGYLMITILRLGQGAAASVGENNAGILGHQILTVYPNPSTGGALIEYVLSVPMDVTLTIHDVAGRKIATLAEDYHPAGKYQVQWDGRSDSGIRSSAGSYYATLLVGEETISRKIVHIR